MTPKHSKLAPVSLNPTVAQATLPAVTPGQAENRIDIYAFQTRAGGTLVLYPGDRTWARVTVTLLTAGPVAVGQQSQLTPVLSGKGQLLQTAVPAVFDVPRGNKLYVAATGINPLNVKVEAYPWLETITGLATAGVGPALARRSSGKVG